MKPLSAWVQQILNGDASSLWEASNSGTRWEGFTVTMIASMMADGKWVLDRFADEKTAQERVGSLMPLENVLPGTVPRQLRDDKGFTPLMTAALFGTAANCDSLRESSDTRATTQRGRTAASISDFRESGAYLIKRAVGGVSREKREPIFANDAAVKLCFFIPVLLAFLLLLYGVDSNATKIMRKTEERTALRTDSLSSLLYFRAVRHVFREVAYPVLLGVYKILGVVATFGCVSNEYVQVLLGGFSIGLFLMAVYKLLFPTTKTRKSSRPPASGSRSRLLSVDAKQELRSALDIALVKLADDD